MLPHSDADATLICISRSRATAPPRSSPTSGSLTPVRQPLLRGDLQRPRRRRPEGAFPRPRSSAVAPPRGSPTPVPPAVEGIFDAHAASSPYSKEISDARAAAAPWGLTKTPIPSARCRRPEGILHVYAAIAVQSFATHRLLPTFTHFTEMPNCDSFISLSSSFVATPSLAPLRFSASPGVHPNILQPGMQPECEKAQCLHHLQWAVLVRGPKRRVRIQRHCRRCKCSRALPSKHGQGADAIVVLPVTIKLALVGTTSAAFVVVDLGIGATMPLGVSLYCSDFLLSYRSTSPF